ncbi:MAG TPA: nitroreductase family protein [Nitrososphaerales archaeon]|nr:nitroreductase family protein [Nitrososphaerales archaeon]HUK74265.1 nitroreductase family protein [Nitrososphaerales archaeon]
MSQSSVGDSCRIPVASKQEAKPVEQDVIDALLKRQSSKGGFDSQRKVDAESLGLILEAARWTPTAHNMQNFEIVVVDDRDVLAELGRIKGAPLTETYLREHLATLSFSEEELLNKKTGLLGMSAPQTWRDPSMFAQAIRDSPPSPLAGAMKGCPTLLVVTYDPSKRAPASEADFLGVVSLGCLMENVWIAANALGIGVKILSALGEAPVDEEVKRILGVPAGMKVAFGICLGYPAAPPGKNLRVRRDLKDVAYHNRYGSAL